MEETLVTKAQIGAGYGEELESVETKLPSEEKGIDVLKYMGPKLFSPLRAGNLVNAFTGGALNAPSIGLGERNEKDAYLKKYGNEEEKREDIKIQIETNTDETILDSPIDPDITSMKDNALLKGTPYKGGKELEQAYEYIQHENVKKAVVEQTGRFHADFYDLLYNPETGVFMLPHNKLSGDQKRFILGFTNDYKEISDLLNNGGAVKRAEHLLNNNGDFIDWWNEGGQSSVITVEGSKLPLLVVHGTKGLVVPQIGFWNRHAADLPPIEQIASAAGGKMTAMGFSRELASNFGTLNQAASRLLGEDSLEVEGKPLRDPDLLSAVVTHDNNNKFYPGFIKMNKPLNFERDLGSWDLSTILHYLSKENLLNTKEGEKLTYNMIPKFFSSYVGGGATLGQPGVDPLMDRFGDGTALKRVLTYAREMYEDDAMNRGIEPDPWEEKGIYIGSRSTHEDIEYYSYHGLIKFINQDLGYDGIRYRNEHEDADLTDQPKDWSYILFHPWQFKSYFQDNNPLIKGQFKWGRRNYMGKTKEKPNKYQKVV